MPRYKCILEYNGTFFSGWQKQPGQISVQQTIEDALTIILKKEIEVVASGRTDAGVHARGQVIHFDLPETVDADKLMGSVNFFLRPSAVAIVDIREVNENFHARFSAKKRSYRYHIINRRAPLIIDQDLAWLVTVPLDVSAMQEAANYLIGKHDFSSFRDSQCQAKSPIKTMTSITVQRDEDLITIATEAPSYLHHMIRNIVGTLKSVGEGKWPAQNMISILEAKDRTKAGPTAPACGLYFVKAVY